MDFEIIRAQARDYKNISECWKTVRGENYYDKDVYTPEYIKENSVFAVFGEGGETIAAIAVSYGLFGSDYNYMGMLAVKKEYTGKGLATQLLRHIILHLCERNSSCMKAHIVTGVNTVQKMAEKQGLLPAGFLFGVRDNEKALPDKTLKSDKRTLIVYVKPNAKSNCGELFVSKSINDLTEKVYGSLGVSFVINNTGEAADESVIQTYRDNNHGVIYIKALKCGRDLSKKLSALTADCDDSSLITAMLLININAPSAIYGYNEARALGFVFSGFEPLDNDNEYITMFYKGNVVINANEIKTTEKSNELLKGVLKIENYDLR